MPTAISIKNQLNTFASRHREDPSGELATLLADLAKVVNDLEDEIQALRNEVHR
ncbi:MAG TPA: hypothetical protein VG815_12615 [Chloroflexota bacterium]|jgi:hypothetical protein|nr:hypothetical protein [Chloroflexota bacterium]